jgi:hypothetical protein
MSKAEEKKIKKVLVKESELIDLLDVIVQEAVKDEKKNWLAEQAEANKEKDALIESRITELEEKISNLKG